MTNSSESIEPKIETDKADAITNLESAINILQIAHANAPVSFDELELFLERVRAYNQRMVTVSFLANNEPLKTMKALAHAFLMHETSINFQIVENGVDEAEFTSEYRARMFDFSFGSVAIMGGLE